MENIIKTIFPSYCIFCGGIGDMVCYKCAYKCKVINEAACIVCQRPAVGGKTHSQCLLTHKMSPTELFSCFEYDKVVRACIMQSKYPPLEYGSLKDLSFYGVKHALSTGYFLSGYYVTAIPLSKNKLRVRGFNQADIICEKLSQSLGLRTLNSVLVRKKDTVAQAEFGREERRKNMSGVFVADQETIQSLPEKDRKFLLVDDICTTGATLLEATQALYKAGAKEVRCFTLARVSLQNSP